MLCVNLNWGGHYKVCIIFEYRELLFLLNKVAALVKAKIENLYFEKLYCKYRNEQLAKFIMSNLYKLRFIAMFLVKCCSRSSLLVNSNVLIKFV